MQTYRAREIVVIITVSKSCCLINKDQWTVIPKQQRTKRLEYSGMLKSLCSLLLCIARRPGLPWMELGCMCNIHLDTFMSTHIRDPDSGIRKGFARGIRNAAQGIQIPSSSDKESGIQCVGTRIQDCIGFPPHRANYAWFTLRWGIFRSSTY